MVRILVHDYKLNFKDDNTRNSQIIEGENWLGKPDLGLN